MCKMRGALAETDSRKLIVLKKMKTMKSNEEDANKYVEFLMNERREQEKQCKYKKHNLKKSASLFVARRMHAVVTARIDTLKDVDEELKELFEV